MICDINNIKFGVYKMKLTAYSVKLKKVVEIAEPKIVTMKNGRKAVQGVAKEDPSSKVQLKGEARWSLGSVAPTAIAFSKPAG